MKTPIVITGTDPNFNHCCSAESQIGTKGVMVGSGPENKVAIKFIPTDLGYDTNEDKFDRITLYIRKDLVKVV